MPATLLSDICYLLSLYRILILSQLLPHSKTPGFLRGVSVFCSSSFLFYNKFILWYNPFVVAPNLATERGCKHAIHNIFLDFRRSKCGRLLHLQMARWKWQRQLAYGGSTVKREENPGSGYYWGFRLCLHAHNIFLADAIIAYSLSQFKYSSLFW